MIDPVYILIRSSGRPKFFNAMWESIQEQTYPNIVTIVHSDDPADEYIKGDIVIESTRDPKAGKGFYNLYNNRLLQMVPGREGWIVFLDDDDKYASPDAIERFVANSLPDHLNVARSRRWENTVYPRRWRFQKSFQSECFMLPARYKDASYWWNKRGGDHYYTRQLTKFLPINWIDDLLVAEAQVGKGRGERNDLGDPIAPPKSDQWKDVDDIIDFFLDKGFNMQFRGYR